MLEKVTFMRNLFYRGFLIALAIYIVTCLLVLFFKDFSYSMVLNYFNITKEQINIITIAYMGMFKFFIMFFFLIPAFTLHWTENILKNQAK